MMKMIITADWHLRASLPKCRKDENWMETQRKALDQIVKISKEKNAPVFVVGDIFHSNSDTSFECITLVQNMANELGELFIIAGNHDLPYHSSENLHKSAIGILLKSDFVHSIKYINNYNKSFWGKTISAANFDEEDNEDAEIVFKHVLTLPEKNPLFESETPESLLIKFENAKWIFTGDYHKNFHYEKNGRHVVNPGCLLRQVSDFKNYQPLVYFVDTDENIVEEIPIIDKEELIDDSYIIKQDERENRISEFVDKLKETKGVSLDFLDNVEKSIISNNISDELKITINELLEV